MIKKTIKVAVASIMTMTIFVFTVSAQVLPSSDGTIIQINAGGGNVAVRATNTVNSGNENCDNNGTFILQNTNENFKDVYAGILTAYAANRTIRFGTLGCFAPGGLSFPVIQSITLR